MGVIDDILVLNSKCRISEEIGNEYQLGAKEIECITAIGRKATMHSNSVASCIALSPSRSSRILKRLTDRGFIESIHDSVDRRYVNLRLTEEGQSCYRALEKRKQECERRLFAGLDTSEQRTVREGLHLLLNII